jgi:hypothetical protein
VEGRPAIASFIGRVASGPAQPVAGPATRRIVRHNLTTIRFTELAPTIARVESYFTVVTEVGLDHYGRYRDTFVPVDDRWLIRHRFVATDWRSPDSTMAREP